MRGVMASFTEIEPQSEQQERVRGFLKNPEAFPEEVYAAIEGLKTAELRGFGFDYFYINLLATLSPFFCLEAIERIAQRCNKLKLHRSWAHHRYVIDLFRQHNHAQPRLHDWDGKQLDEALSRGKGLIVCSAHFGSFRDLSFDLMLMGFRVWMAVDSESACKLAGLSASVTCGNEASLNRQRGSSFRYGHGALHVVDVEREKTATLQLLAALRRNDVVLVFIDGNTGSDGSRGESNRVQVDFLGVRCSVKTGVATLTRASEAGLLQVMTRHGSPSSRPRVVWQRLVSQSRQRSRPGPETEIQRLTQDLYTNFAEEVLKDPEQWEGACLVHRWRASAPAPAPDRAPSDTPERVRNEIGTRYVYRLNAARVVSVKRPDGIMLLDIETTRIYRLPVTLEWLIDALAGPGYPSPRGLSEDRKQDAQPDTESFLTYLSDRSCVIEREVTV